VFFKNNFFTFPQLFSSLLCIPTRIKHTHFAENHITLPPLGHEWWVLRGHMKSHKATNCSTCPYGCNTLPTTIAINCARAFRHLLGCGGTALVVIGAGCSIIAERSAVQEGSVVWCIVEPRCSHLYQN